MSAAAKLYVSNGGDRGGVQPKSQKVEVLDLVGSAPKL